MEQLTIYDPYWLVGFVSADGSFLASPYRVKAFRARFFITQHSKDLHLLELIKSYLGVGNIYKNGNSFNYAVESIKDCLNYIIPFFDKYPIPSISTKYHNFEIWKEIVKIIHSNGHKTLEGKLQIIYSLSKLNKETYQKSSYIYMFNRDKTILYYYSMQPKDFIDILKIHYVTFEKHLENGTYYLGKYLFTKEPVLVVKFKKMSIAELTLMLDNDRLKYKQKKKLTFKNRQ